MNFNLKISSFNKKKKKLIYWLCIILFVILILEIFLYAFFENKDNEKELDTWLGWYCFNSKFVTNGKSFSDRNEIYIFKINGDYYAELICNGVPHPARLLGYVKGNENSINIFFKDILPGDSLYEENRYEDDELLVALLYEDSELYTSWHALRREYSIILEKGLYYRKVRQYSEDGELLDAP